MRFPIRLSCLCGLLLGVRLTGAVRVETTRSEQETVTQVKQKVYLNAATFNIAYQTRNGVDTVRKQWGDHFFGLCFGCQPGTSGSWSVWNFFELFEWSGGRHVNLIQEKVPEWVSAMTNRGVSQARMVFPATGRGKLELRFMTFAAHPHWLFMRVSPKDFSAAIMRFWAYPGNSDDPPFREHWLGTVQRHVRIEDQAATLAPLERCIAFYNRYVQTRGGNYLIMDSREFTERRVPSAGGQGVGITLIPRHGVRHFHIALGFFADEEAGQAVARFLREDGDSIAQFMSAMSWDLEVPIEEFTRECAVSRQLGVSEAALAELCREFSVARGQDDISRVMDIMNRLKALKREAVSLGLRRFR